MIDNVPFGHNESGAPVQLWRMRNASGALACVSTLGAALVRLDAPDSQGRLADVTLGFDDAESYLADNNYLGCIVGRYANRIAGGTFSIDGRSYRVPCNDGGNVLHGGVAGFHRKVWRASVEGDALRLDLDSPDGDGGFPGAVKVTARYAFGDDFTLRLSLEATTTKPTPLNLTLHAYWNLAGAGTDSVLNHHLKIWAQSYTPVGANMIPTGTIDPVADSPLDFRVAKAIGRDIAQNHPQLVQAAGYDHNYAVDGFGLRPVAQLTDPVSGRRLTLHTDQIGLQLYSLNALHSPLLGKAARVYRARSAIALEPQGFPDAPNHPHFPSAILRPGETYRATSVYAFDAIG